MPSTSLGTLVTYNPWSIGPMTELDEIAVRFAELRIHHVPVVDAERRVVGVVSETDLLRARQANRAVLVGPSGTDTADPPLVFARDVMTRDVVSISATPDSRDALSLLLNRQIHILPVVDAGRLVGMVSSRDFLREFSYGEMPGAREPISRLLSATPPEPFSADTTLDEALLAMQETGAGCLVIGQGDCPIGIVSQRDIIREKCRLDDQQEFHTQTRLKAGLLQVTRNSPAIRSGQSLCEAAAAMVDHSLPAVTIVNQSNRLLGLITEDDLLRVLYDSLA